jgi:hypothetical protein
MWIAIVIFAALLGSGCVEKEGGYKTNNRELNDYEDAVRNHESNLIHGQQFRERWND